MNFTHTTSLHMLLTSIAAKCRKFSMFSLSQGLSFSPRSWVSANSVNISASMTKASHGVEDSQFVGNHSFAVQGHLYEQIKSTTPHEADLHAKSDSRLTPMHEAHLASQRNKRKLALLKRAGLFSGNTEGAVIERACSVEDLRKAYRLVHDVFLGTGYISPEPAGLRLRIFETTSEMATFVAKVDGRVVGVLSMIGDTQDFGLPCDSAFKVELDALRASGAKLCELTNQAVEEEYRKSAVPTELMRCAMAHSLDAGYDENIATVSPSHNGFYELFGLSADWF